MSMIGSFPSAESRPKTVLHIFSGDLWAGAEVMIYNLLSTLKNYPEVNVVALSLNEGILTEKLINNGIETYVISESNYGFPQICLKALKLFKKRKIDIIHSHRYKENLLALMLGKTLRVNKLITTIHGLFENPAQGDNGVSAISFKSRVDYFLLNSFFTNIIAVSKEMQERLICSYGFNPSNISVIYNGITIPPTNQPINQSLPSTERPIHIGTVGRLVPIKGFDLFLEVAAEIRQHMNNVRFSILGDGSLKNQLMQKAKELGIDKHIKFVEPVEDPIPYYKTLDLFLNTSYYEGIPLSILEAMACGVPVVAPKVGGIPEIIESKNEGILYSRDQHDIASICIKTLIDKNLMNLRKSSMEKIHVKFSKLLMSDSYIDKYCNE